jgi:CubicO group peptidase (beta-lactamase class C family)
MNRLFKLHILVILILMIEFGGWRSTGFAGVFPGTSWKEVTPESQGVSSDKLEEALGYLASICHADGVRQTMVIRNGYLIWKGDDINKVHDVFSCTKTFTSTVLGLLISDKKCSLATLARDWVPSLNRYYPELTLLHFTTLTSGYESFNRKWPFDPSKPLFKPGSRFHYGDASMNQFANVLTRIAGEPLDELFKRRVADQIGMDTKEWWWGDFGSLDGLRVNGGSGGQSRGMHISARQFARFGLLFLNDGAWAGKQLISADWVKLATSPQVSPSIAPYDPKAWYSGLIGAYGFNWWVNGIRQDGRRMWPSASSATAAAQGNYNNICFIVPDWDMVIVRLGTDGRINNSLYDNFFAKMRLAISGIQRKLK